MGREAPSASTANYTFITWITNSPNGLSSDLQPLRSRLYETSRGDLDGQRDALWADRLALLVATGNAAWAAAVVGSAHTDARNPESLAARLQDRGVVLEVRQVDLQRN